MAIQLWGFSMAYGRKTKFKGEDIVVNKQINMSTGFFLTNCVSIQKKGDNNYDWFCVCVT